LALTPHQTIALALDPAMLFEICGLVPDPWQQELLRSTAPRILLNCCRQAGKSTTVAALALHTAIFQAESVILLLSRSQRQSSELFRKVLGFFQAVEARAEKIARVAARSASRLELTNGSRILSLPGQEGTLRSYSGVRLLIIDEAARVSTDLYRAVRPMLAVSGGRLILLSTPFGRRGFYYQAYADPVAHWHRFEVRAEQVPRISRAFLDEERRTLGRSWFNQEYACSFEAVEGLVYPDFATCVVQAIAAELHMETTRPTTLGRLVGGIDFGFRNPFAAVWGVLDRHDVLWLFGEHYERHTPLHQHAAKLPRTVAWYADPAGANEIAELRCGGFVVRKGDNALQAGIAAVTARIQTGRLKVLADGCPHLLSEAQLYRYPSHAEGGVDPEKPIDEHNHALAALRYLVSRIDAHCMVRLRRSTSDQDSLLQDAEASEEDSPRKSQPWLRLDNNALWTRLNA